MKPDVTNGDFKSASKHLLKRCTISRRKVRSGLHLAEQLTVESDGEYIGSMSEEDAERFTQASDTQEPPTA